MWIGEMCRRLRYLLRRSRLDRELEEEIGFHLERLGDQRPRFGNVTRVREESWEAWGWRWLDELVRDLRYGLRTLRRSPAVTAAAVLSLALGIGANTAIFSLLDAVLLRMLPVAGPERLVLLQKYHQRAPGGDLSYPLYTRLRDHDEAFAGVLATAGPGRSRMRINDDPETMTSEWVSGNYFAVLGVPAVLGRTLTLDDEKERQPVAVISHRFWQGRFGGDARVIGKTIALADEAATIVGVAAPEFFGIEVGHAVDLWRPLTVQQPWPANAGFNWLTIMARLKLGTGRAQAQAAAQVVFRQFLADVAGTRAAGWTEKAKQDYLAQRLEVQPGGTGFSRLRQQFSEPLRILMAVVGLVLRESVVVVAAGAAVGSAAAVPATGLVSKLLFGVKPADPWAVAGALGLLLTVTLFAGYLPARLAARVDPSAALKYE